MTVQTALQKARWVGTDYVGSPIIERRFTLDTVAENTVLTVTGLGYFKASINGIPVTDDRFQPHVTDYERRAFTKITYPCRDTFTHRIYVCRYPVAELLTAGENVLEIDGKAFYSCWALQRIIVDENNPNYCDIDGVLYTKDKKTVVSILPYNVCNVLV